MTVKNFIDKSVRPCIGDTLHQQDSYVQANPPVKQLAKYPFEVLLDHLNEGVLDIARNSDMFIKTGYALIRKNQTDFIVPHDYLGFYTTDTVSAGVGADWDSSIPLLKVMPTRNGLKITTPVTENLIKTWQNTLQGVDLPDDIIDYLIATNQITAPAIPQLATDLLADAILIDYEYRYLPDEFTENTELTDRELMYLLRWYTASHVLYGDMHNEASNLAQIYEIKYKQRLEKAGQTYTNWNDVSLSPWSGMYDTYV